MPQLVGMTYNGIPVPRRVRTDLVLSAFCNPIDEDRVTYYVNALDCYSGIDVDPVTGYPTILDESDEGEYFLSGEEVTSEHFGQTAWRVCDGHHRTLAHIEAGREWIDVEVEYSAITSSADKDRYWELVRRHNERQ